MHSICIFYCTFPTFQLVLSPLYEAAFIADQSLFIVNDNNPVRPL